MITQSDKFEQPISHVLPYFGNSYSYGDYASGKFGTGTTTGTTSTGTTGTTGTTTTTTTSTATTSMWIDAASSWLSTIGNTVSAIFRKTPETVVYTSGESSNTTAWIVGGGVALVLVVLIIVLAKKK